MDNEKDPQPVVTGVDAAKVRDRLLRIAAYVTPTILALQGQAHAKSENAPGIIQAPVLSPPAIVALATALATVGAYRLRKAKQRAARPEDKEPRP